MKKHTQQGFTLIELLVVITIIAILMGLAIPAVSTALQAAKKAEATAIMSQMQTALVQYNTEYNTYPAFLTSLMSASKETIDVKTNNAAWKDLYEVLTATPGNGTTTITANITANNSRRIAFMEIPPKYTGPNSAAKTILDPWGNTYGIGLDTDYDNQIQKVPDPKATNPKTANITINGSVVLWSFGVDNPDTANAAEIKKGMVSTYK